MAHTGVLTNNPQDPDLPQSYTETVTVTIPDHTDGQYYLVQQADLYRLAYQEALRRLE